MEATYLATKPRYEVLDGLRGVAAMMVVAFHISTPYTKGFNLIINHGYLAVDFFFVLSGFVVGYAYDDRWDKMTTWSFFKRRLIRLHPMLVAGTLIGAIFFYFQGDNPAHPGLNATPAWLVVVIALLCMAMIPIPRSFDIRGWGEMNPLDGPQWSLFWEYLANIAYALFIRKFSKSMLAAFMLCSAVLTLILCLNVDVFGWLQARSYARYTVLGGWSLTPAHLQIGLTRLLYPFFCGLLLSKNGKLISIRGGFWWCSLILVTLLTLPRVGGDNPENFWMNGLYEAFCILVAFPLIVAVGAGSSTKGKTTAINRFLGDISYPLYITHYPLIYMQMSWAESHRDLPAGTHIFVVVCIFAFDIAIAYASLKLYDEPVREWLKQILFKKKSS